MTSDRRAERRSPLGAIVAFAVSILFLLAMLGTTFVLVTGRSPLSLLRSSPAFGEEPAESAAVINEAPQVEFDTGQGSPTPQQTDAETPTATATLTSTPTSRPSPTPIPTSTETPTPPPLAAVDADVLNVRNGPGTVYAVIDQVAVGEQMEVNGRNTDASWIQVCCFADDGEGWVSSEFVDLTVDATTLPIAVIPPTPEPTATPETAPPIAPVASAPTEGGDNRAVELARPAEGLPGPGGFGAPGGTNPLTGLPLPPGRAGQRPLIVCINNDFAARPQFGTSQADLMIEYLMEGYSITRFSGVFYGDESAQIGPIRSARLVNYYMGALYDAGLVCSGASDPVRFLLKHSAPFPYLDIDLDDPSNSRYTTSVGSDYRTRLRTSSDGLRRWMSAIGAERAPSLRSLFFGELADGGAPASAISIPYPSVTGSQVSYRYDGSSGRYLRFMGGAPHVDGNTGSQLAFDNVIVQFVPHETTNIIEDSLGSRSIRLNLFGSGRAILFRNGIAFEGTWRSDSQGDLPRFFDGGGREISLKPGRSWLSIVPLTYSIGYQ